MSDSPNGLPAVEGARGTAVILSANPIHDTGGGQRSAQIALELLARGWAVLFVSHGEVTETVDLALTYDHERLVQVGLADIAARKGRALVRSFLAAPRAMVVTQVPVRAWLPALRWAKRAGAVRVYDLIDEWDSALGYGWYRGRTERRIISDSQLLVATAPTLARHVEAVSRRPVHLLPNAFNGRLFKADADFDRPADLPDGTVALYVGSLWGGWMDWALVDKAARALPAVAFTFIGDHRGEGKDLPDNCHFLGLKAQADLPPYLAHSRVGILPWHHDDVTKATSPLKVYEYVAMGLPVIAPALEPLEGIPGVSGCSTTDEFVDVLRGAIAGDVGEAVRSAMATFAEANSWTRRVEELLALVEDQRSAPSKPTLVERLRDVLGL